jgi:hypothetical protein
MGTNIPIEIYYDDDKLELFPNVIKLMKDMTEMKFPNSEIIEFIKEKFTLAEIIEDIIKYCKTESILKIFNK